MEETIEAIEAIATKAEHIYNDNSIVEMPNDKYAERHMFYLQEDHKYLVFYSVYDNFTDEIHFKDWGFFPTRALANEFYHSIPTDIGGKPFIYSQSQN